MFQTANRSKPHKTHPKMQKEKETMTGDICKDKKLHLLEGIFGLGESCIFSGKNWILEENKSLFLWECLY